MFSLFYSNQLEILVDHLIDHALQFHGKGRSTFSSFEIVVPNPSVKDYIELCWAKKTGISVNISSVLINEWIEKFFFAFGEAVETVFNFQNGKELSLEKIFFHFENTVENFLSIKAPKDEFSIPYLQWRLFLLIKELSDVNQYHDNPLKISLLKNEFLNKTIFVDGPVQYTFVKRLAKIFHNYAQYRSDWLNVAEQKDLAFINEFFFVGDENYIWQAELWKLLTEKWNLGKLRKDNEVIQKFHNFFEKRDDYFYKKNITFTSFRKDEYLLNNLYSLSKKDKGSHRKKLIFIVPVHIPPEIMRKLIYLSPFVDIDLFVLNPCSEYWFDLVSTKKIGNLRRKGKLDQHEAGHRLLSDWGKFTQMLLLQINEAVEISNSWIGLDADFDSSSRSYFIRNTNNNLLGNLQNGILNLKDQGVIDCIQAQLIKKEEIVCGDTSIQIHVCHTVLRQLEVCYDVLVSLFEKDSSFRPCNVLIVMPDLINHLALIDVVFGFRGVKKADPFFSLRRKLKKIPYKIVLPPLNQQMGSSENSLVKVFLDILLLSTKIISVDTLFDWLDNDAFAKQYALDLVNKMELKNICKHAGARILFNLSDKNSQENSCHFFSPEGSFAIESSTSKIFNSLDFRIGITLEDALQRLLLSDIMGEASGPITSMDKTIRLLPIGINSTSITQEILNQLRKLYEDLQLFSELSSHPLDIASWCDLYHAALDSFFGAAAFSNQWKNTITMLTALIEEIRFEVQSSLRINCETNKNLDEELVIDAATMHAIFLDKINSNDKISLGSSISEKVVFTTPEQARFIPHRMVAMLNFNYDNWPMGKSSDPYNLLEHFPRFGDFDPRANEQAIFLDLILSARELLFISFNGRDPVDDSVIPPASQVSDLIDYLADQYASKVIDPLGWENVKNKFVFYHPLYAHEEIVTYCQHEEIVQPLHDKLKSQDLLTQDSDTQNLEYDLRNVKKGVYKYQILTKCQEENFFESNNWYLSKNQLEKRNLDLKEILSFWNHPCKYFFYKQLGVDLGRKQASIDKNDESEEKNLDYFIEEDFSLMPESRFRLVDQLLQVYFGNGRYTNAPNWNLEQRIIIAQEIAQAIPALPIGILGDLSRSDEIMRIRAFINTLFFQWNKLSSNKESQFFDIKKVVDFSIFFPIEFNDKEDHILQNQEKSEITIKGRLDGILPSGRLVWRYSKLSAAQILSVWIEHLILNILIEDSQSELRYLNNLREGDIAEYSKDEKRLFASLGKTILIGRDVYLYFKPVNNAAFYLSKLIYLFHLGTFSPLPFFVKTAYELAKNKVSDAKNLFFGSNFVTAENNDSYYQCAFGSDFLNKIEFSTISNSNVNYLSLLEISNKTPAEMGDLIFFLGREVYAPLLAHVKEMTPTFELAKNFYV